MFPSKHLDMGFLKDILSGGHDKVVEAGARLVGGHTVDDEEPKYGLCVNGVVHPEKIITNAGSQPGDGLILTKPLGSGVLFNAVRSGKLPFRELERDTLPSLAALNGPAMEAALKYDLHACTDITGFGILGHLLEVAHGSDARVVVRYENLPFYPAALEMYKKGETTGSNNANREMVAKHRLTMEATLSSDEEELLYDPQTSGGLLLSLPASQVDDLLSDFREAGMTTAVKIGEVIDEPVGITVVK
jgi:selenide,water dikinase